MGGLKQKERSDVSAVSSKENQDLMEKAFELVEATDGAPSLALADGC
jgi:hypothetical protein